MTKKERERERVVKEQEESKDYNKTSRTDFTLLNFSLSVLHSERVVHTRTGLL